jgi:hypothetical protein
VRVHGQRPPTVNELYVCMIFTDRFARSITSWSSRHRVPDRTVTMRRARVEGHDAVVLAHVEL